uniref:Solute carrier organic anion transporter family member 4A1-like n=1 Tax=Saccoglossus kowalevskii TaxID=10224 RepID=A0ABM0MIC5_SACKO|nr:PREDICTED: solute carrier organic anion transporter family member 4A1-like [Saccoglossus kowalevskii]
MQYPVYTVKAEYGICEEDCWQLILYVILFFTIMLVGFTILAPLAVLGMRTVPDSQRSYALGISSLMYRLLGAVPGPIIVGAAIDSACIVWQEHCDSTGKCHIYDNADFAWKWFIVGFVFYGITVIFYILALFTYKEPQNEEIEPITYKLKSENTEDSVMGTYRTTGSFSFSQPVDADTEPPSN